MNFKYVPLLNLPQDEDSEQLKFEYNHICTVPFKVDEESIEIEVLYNKNRKIIFFKPKNENF